MNQPGQAICEADKGKRAVMGVVYPSGLGVWRKPCAGTRGFPRWGAVFGMGGAQESCRCLNG